MEYLPFPRDHFKEWINDDFRVYFYDVDKKKMVYSLHLKLLSRYNGNQGGLAIRGVRFTIRI